MGCISISDSNPIFFFSCSFLWHWCQTINMPTINTTEPKTIAAMASTDRMLPESSVVANLRPVISAAVGLAVMVCVGFLVGDAVVGTVVGVAVGDFVVGTSVGAFVGAFVGAIVGAFVGAFVVGLDVGDVGLAVGVPVHELPLPPQTPHMSLVALPPHIL